MYDVLVIGGGAAGFFSAIQSAIKNPRLKIAILEKGKEVLTKVKISGGGRCNVTHAEFVPKKLSENYPRGGKELIGPFHTFCSGDTIEFFEERKVPLKIEPDGRIFPVSDSSTSIINCFLKEAEKYKIQIITEQTVKHIGLSSTQTFNQNKLWEVETNQQNYSAVKLIITSGSNLKIWEMLKSLAHTIIPPVPSLFTFNIKDARIDNLAGVSTIAAIKILHTNLKTEGPLLITHWGLSGPAVLKLSAWGAVLLHKADYKFKVQVNWLHQKSFDQAYDVLNKIKREEAKKQLINTNPFNLPKRLWLKLVEASAIADDIKCADITKNQLFELAKQLTQSVFEVSGKSTFKEEFVTAGGVDLKEVDFKRFESKLHKNLFFAGEVLNIDAVTGGFNFQNAWTGAYIAAQAIAED